MLAPAWRPREPSPGVKGVAVVLLAPLLWWPCAAPPPPLLGVLRRIPLGVGVICDWFFLWGGREAASRVWLQCQRLEVLVTPADIQQSMQIR